MHGGLIDHEQYELIKKAHRCGDGRYNRPLAIAAEALVPEMVKTCALIDGGDKIPNLSLR